VEHGWDPVAERVALSDDTFRRANEGIAATSIALGIDGLLPFIYECANTKCTAMLRLTREEYEAVRREPTHFLIVQGHEHVAEGWAIVVATHARYAVVAKIGDAAVITEQRDPRRQEAHGPT
jgi:hypothetical protein